MTGIIVADDIYIDLLRLRRETTDSQSPMDCGSPSFMGFPIRKSHMFPFTVSCATCGGSGSGGETSTYCQTCAGRGQTHYLGAVVAAETHALIVADLPRKFEPTFPVPVPIQPMRYP